MPRGREVMHEARGAGAPAAAGGGAATGQAQAGHGGYHDAGDVERDHGQARVDGLRCGSTSRPRFKNRLLADPGTLRVWCRVCVSAELFLIVRHWGWS